MRHLSIVLGVMALFFSFTPCVNAAASGSLIKSVSSDSVYYVINGNRFAFPNEKVFFSWYNDFESVLPVSANELANYTLAGNVTYRPGRWLVKIQTDPKVYAVSRYGILRWITSEEVARALYGTNWATKVQDIPDTFFINYEIGTPIVNAQDYSSQTELTITQISQDISGIPVPIITNIQEAKEFDTAILINQHRRTKGSSALVWNDTIANAARLHSENMATGTVAFGHGGFSTRINGLRATITFLGASENVAANNGFDDAVTTAVQGWLKSPDHLVNIENSAYNQTGVGVALSRDGSYYFTQIFVQNKLAF